MTLVPAGYVPVCGGAASSPDLLVPETMALGEVLVELGRPAAEAAAVIGAAGSSQVRDAMSALRTPIVELPPVGRIGDSQQPKGGIELSTVGGLDAGATIHLGSGVHRLPSGTLLEVSDLGPVPEPWAEAARRIEALSPEIPGSRPSSKTDAPAEGLSVHAVSPPVDVEPSRSQPFRRPPRIRVVDADEALEPPEMPAPLGAPTPLSWASLLAPLPIALAMAFFFRPLFALFALMGPVLVLGRWLEQRRRRRKQTEERLHAVQAATAATALALRHWCGERERRAWLEQPHVAQLLRRAQARSVRTWERRLDDVDRLRVMVGVGPRWVVPTWASSPSPELGDGVNAPVRLRSVPHTVDLLGHGGLGTFGDLEAGRAVVRSLVLQLTTLNGPADLAVAVIASDPRSWDWVKWLPHVDVELVAAPYTTTAWAQLAGRAALIVVDDPGADVASLARAAADAEVELTVLSSAESAGELPAACTHLVGLDHVGRIQVAETGTEARLEDQVVAVGISVATANEWAQALARFVDPELEVAASAGALDAPSLPELLNLCGAEEMVRANAAAAACDDRSGSLPFVLGVDRDGLAGFDLVVDGPHALVAGTTGSGKSELLRTMVLSMAASRTPAELSFVLADFKGGGAFDGCAGLPHVAGLITDLDAALVERALAGLRAEVRDRELQLRRGERVGRLVMVIDEFAVLAQEHPTVLDGLIDLAARGRSLGMHLVLATQKPSGVVDHRIRANTNLRIALRVQHATESHDVVGVADAAHLDRRRPGRAIVRVGSDEVQAIQVAQTAPMPADGPGHRVRPFLLPQAAGANGSFDGRGKESRLTVGSAAHVEPPLDRLARWITRANTGFAAPQLWTPPLPDRLAYDATHGSAPSDAYVLGLADHAATRRRSQHLWRPADGGLVLFSGDAEPIAHLVDALLADIVAGAGPIDHAYVIGASSIIDPSEHACIGAVIPSTDRERIERLLAELERGDGQEQPPTAVPQVVVVISDIGSMLSGFDDLERLSMVERLEQIARQAGSGRVHLVVGARSVRDLPHRVAQHMRQRLLGRVADPTAHLMLGTTPVTSESPMHVVDVDSDVAVVLRDRPTAPITRSANSAVAPPIGRCPSTVSVAEAGAMRAVDGGFDVDLGIRYDDLTAATLPLRGGRAVLVAGPPGSGRTNVIGVLEGLAREIGVTVQRIGPDTDPDEVLAADASTAVALVLVDDAERLADPVVARLRELIERPHSTMTIVIASTIEAARSARSLGALARASGTGLLVGGGPLDGEIFRLRRPELPGLGQIPGRATLVVAGRAVGVQLAIDPRSA